MKKLNIALILALLTNAMAGIVPAQAAPPPLPSIPDGAAKSAVVGTSATEVSTPAGAVKRALDSAPLEQAPPPPLPSSFYGTVKLNGADAPAGTLVSAWIAGEKYAETAASSSSGSGSTFVLDVPGDERDTPSIEGGREGQAIIFRVGRFAAGQLAVWHSGTVVELNLTAIESDAPDLAVINDDGQTMILSGQVLTYTLAVINIGLRDASGIALTDTLPANTTLVAASDGGSAVGGAVTWPAFDLAADASASRSVTVRVDDLLPASLKAITNAVTVADDGTHGVDPFPENN